MASAAPVDHAQLDKLCEKAITAFTSGRFALAAAFFRRASEEARQIVPTGETFVSAFLALHSSNSLLNQSDLDGVTDEEEAALCADAWALASTTLPFIKRRVDDNTMLPGRGTAVETAFYKRFITTGSRVAASHAPPARALQHMSLSLGYVTALEAASQALVRLRKAPVLHPEAHDLQAFVLRVLDSMLPASRSLKDFALPEEHGFACRIHNFAVCAYPSMDPAFLAALHSKWANAAMVAMCKARGLDRAAEHTREWHNIGEARLRADIAAFGLMECALPSCGKREVSVQQFKFCSACRSVWYCSAEHGALHWKEHKPACRATTAAQQAGSDARAAGHEIS